MHELSLAHSVVEILCEEAERHGLQRVTLVKLRIGVLRGVVPQLLETSMAFAAQGTLAEGLRLELEVVPGQAHCPQCGADYAINELLFLCPQCGRAGGQVIAGEDLTLMELEGE